MLGKLPAPGCLIWITVGQGPAALAVGTGGGCLDIFSLVCHFSPLSPSLWETARYRLKYCLKGPLNPKSTNQRFRCSQIDPYPIPYKILNKDARCFTFNFICRSCLTISVSTSDIEMSLITRYGLVEW